MPCLTFPCLIYPIVVQPTPPPAPTTNPAPAGTTNPEDEKKSSAGDGGDKEGSGTVPRDEAKDNNSHEGKVTTTKTRILTFSNQLSQS